MRSPPRLTLAKAPVEVALGLPEEDLSVETYFERFDWEGSAPDAATLSAEDFFTALGP
ncbi:MAG: hypothetical protein Q8N23_35600 [Archangium sp.]|nr:hypothetical protein [Archangium sp.]MDP3158051.1 hypothetical protein [Archangium sp.]MDP3570543.1 hypothetical protein [Archangium sp.]